MSGWSGSARVGRKGLPGEQGVERFNTTVPRCRVTVLYIHNKSTVVITVLDVGVFPLKQQSIYFEDQDLQQLGIKAVPGQYTAYCYDKTSGYHCVLLQE